VKPAAPPASSRGYESLAPAEQAVWDAALEPQLAAAPPLTQKQQADLRRLLRPAVQPADRSTA
jgi:hypothetical protein